MPNTVEQPLRDVPFSVTNPERIPVKRYYDAQFFELEREHLWPHVWQMACRPEEIPDVGDWIEYKILNDSVIVVRTNSGVKAFRVHEVGQGQPDRQQRTRQPHRRHRLLK
jgi:hypothetical protein